MYNRTPDRRLLMRFNNLPSGVLLYIQGYTGQYLINNLPSGVLLYIQGYTGQYLINNLLSGVLLYIQGYTGQYLMTPDRRLLMRY
jgi:glutamate synthase domain-containing protein 3